VDGVNTRRRRSTNGLSEGKKEKNAEPAKGGIKKILNTTVIMSVERELGAQRKRTVINWWRSAQRGNNTHQDVAAHKEGETKAGRGATFKKRDLQ